MSSHRVGGWEGHTAKFVVGNRAQRCDCHKLAGFWWVGGCVVLRADHVLWPFWSRTILRAILKDLPPTQRCIVSVSFDVSAIGSASVQQFYTKCHLIVWAGGRVTLQSLCGGNTMTIRELGLRRGSKAEGLVESSRILAFGTVVMHE